MNGYEVGLCIIGVWTLVVVVGALIVAYVLATFYKIHDTHTMVKTYTRTREKLSQIDSKLQKRGKR